MRQQLLERIARNTGEAGDRLNLIYKDVQEKGTDILLEEEAIKRLQFILDNLENTVIALSRIQEDEDDYAKEVLDDVVW